MAIETKTVTKVTYAVAESFDEYTINGWYPPGGEVQGFSFYSYGTFRPFTAESREDALAYADQRYGPKSGAECGSYKLRETTHTVTTTTEKTDDFSETTKTETHREEVILTSYRTWDEYQEYYVLPRAKWEAERPALEDKLAKQAAERASVAAAEQKLADEAERAAHPVKSRLKLRRKN